MPPRVFISYSSEDKTIADTICRRLESDGVQCRIAPRDIQPGADWTKSIMQAIEGCQVFILVFSKQANERAHQLIRRSWTLCGDYSVGRYVIMPEHIHAFIGESSLAKYRLENWVAAWKSFVSRRWPNLYEKPIWQRSFWDRQIRTGDQYDQKWLYVRNNPVRHGLVEDPDEWPFQGAINILS
jgi:putative transposase